MSFVIATPEMLAAAAADWANIGSTISEANTAAAALTTGLVPAAEDEVSQAVAALFGGYAQDYQALSAQAAAFYERLVRALNTGAASYTGAETANGSLLQNVEQDALSLVNAPTEALLGRPLIGNGADGGPGQNGEPGGLLFGNGGSGGSGIASHPGGGNGGSAGLIGSGGNGGNGVNGGLGGEGGNGGLFYGKAGIDGLGGGPGTGGNVALIMGGTGVAGGTLPSGSPTSEFLNGVVSRYIDPAQPLFTGQHVFPGYNAVGLETLEQDRPYTGLTDSTLADSIADGVSDLNTAIMQTYAGSNIVVLGYSQSATIATLEMNALQASGYTPSSGSLHFVLLGDPNNPNGGIFVRQSALPNIPSYFTATPSNTPYSTDIYTIQYDGYANFPRYPIDLLSDVNAGMGMVYAHLDYSSITPQQLATAVQLATSPGYDGSATYYMIPSQQLPLLEPLYHAEEAVPILKPLIQPVIDLTQPDLKYLVDLGYDDPFASTTYANVATPTALFPNVDQPMILANLSQNTAIGVNAALADVGLPPIAHAGLSQLCVAGHFFAAELR